MCCECLSFWIFARKPLSARIMVHGARLLPIIMLVDELLQQPRYKNRPSRPGKGISYSRTRLASKELDDSTTLRLLGFTAQEIETLALLLAMPPVFIMRARLHVPREEALSVVLARLKTWKRVDVELPRLLGRSPSAISTILTTTLRWLHAKLKTKLSFDFKFAQANLDNFCEAVRTVSGIPNVKIFGFIDGTKVRCARPHPALQHLWYSGHSRTHCLKYQVISTPDGLIAAVSSAEEGRHHDLYLLKDSGVIPKLESIPDFSQHFLYGDSGYFVAPKLLASYPKPQTTAQVNFNVRMSKCRISVEHAIGRVKRLFAALSYWYSIRAASDTDLMIFPIAVFFTNCRTCLDRGNQISSSFKVLPPTIEEYLESS
jgi:hypothetical protein